MRVSSSPPVDVTRSAADVHRARQRRIGTGAAIVLVLAVAAIAVGIGVVRTTASPAASVSIAVDDSAVPPLYVHVSGAVAHPGLYRLDDGARVVDVIAAAGGLNDDADDAAVNLARPLSDGEQLRIPVRGETGPSGVPTGQSDGRINLNTADAAALDTLPRIGPALAARIIAWREENGRFTSVDDLLSVPGIGDKMIAGLRELVTL